MLSQITFINHLNEANGERTVEEKVQGKPVSHGSRYSLKTAVRFGRKTPSFP